MSSSTTAFNDDRNDLDERAALLLAAMAKETEFAPRESPDEIRLIDDQEDDQEMAERERAFTGANGEYHVRNVNVPTLTPYLPDPTTATGAAVLIAPGGGFRMLALDGEGHDVAEWLRARGVAAFVLKYRLRDTGATHAEFAEDLVRSLVAAAQTRSASPTVPVEPEYRANVVDDATAAVNLIRDRAADWNIDPHRLGAIGFSAGAYVLTWALTDSPVHIDALACIYGGRLSEFDLPESAPPLFAAVAARDVLCATDVLALVDAWRLKGASVEAHVYDSDAHGFGIAPRGATTDSWTARYSEWLERIGFAPPVAGD